MILAETYRQLVIDVPHILFELTWEAISGLIFYPVIRFSHKQLSKRIHRDIDKQHGVEH